MIKNILAIIGVIMLVIIFAFTFSYGLDKNEEHECLMWLQQSKQFQGYYFTSWQLMQCEAHEINLLAI